MARTCNGRFYNFCFPGLPFSATVSKLYSSCHLTNWKDWSKSHKTESQFVYLIALAIAHCLSYCYSPFIIKRSYNVYLLKEVFP